MQFQEFNLSSDVEKAVKAMGFEEATPIQAKAIPVIMEGRDVIGQAQTGTGKTCAFAIPAIEMLNKTDEAVQVLVLCPTRELAIQTAEEFKNVSKFTEGVRILPIYGGQPIERQIMGLKKRPQIIIGTPGRVMDHMRRNTLKLGGLKMMILDEADEMLSMGFLEDISTILKKTPEDKQTVLFSATMSKAILGITHRYQTAPEHIEVAHKQVTVSSIAQYYLEVRDASKIDVLSRMIDGNNIGMAIVFCNTKKKVDALTFGLQARGYTAEAIHGDIRQNERSAVMARFKNGDISILVATDVAARGIDVENIEAVFNYDMPGDEEYYVHRIGRTGRAGKTGAAYSFITGREYGKIKNIQRFTKAKITLIKPPTKFDIEESRMNALLKDVAAVVGRGGHDAYAAYVEQVVDEVNTDGADQPDYTTLDVAAALLKMLSKRAAERTAPPVPIKHKAYRPQQPRKRYARR